MPPTARQKAGETDIFKLDGADICTLGLHSFVAYHPIGLNRFAVGSRINEKSAGTGIVLSFGSSAECSGP
jgi:hypothetical protein